MIFGYLIFAHLLGDFFFQPISLVHWKKKSFKGGFVHLIIHFIVTLVVLLPIILNGGYWLIWVIFLMAFTHYFIDQNKINTQKEGNKRVKSFIIDQISHVLVIFAIFLLVKDFHYTLPKGNFYAFYQDPRLIIYFILIILVTSFWEILKFQFQKEKNIKAGLVLNIQHMTNRIIALSLAYIVTLLIIS